MNYSYCVDMDLKTYLYIKNELINKSYYLESTIKDIISNKIKCNKKELEHFKIELTKVNNALECFENKCTICE